MNMRKVDCRGAFACAHSVLDGANALNRYECAISDLDTDSR